MKSKWRSPITGATCFFFAAMHLVQAQAHPPSPPSQAHERGRVVLAQSLPDLQSGNLKASVVEVNYGPGESSPPHSHPCPVIAYVAEGAIRTQVKGSPEHIAHAGESFYEPPGGVHLVSANASQTAPAKLIAFFVCDHDAPLSTNVEPGLEEHK